MRKGIDCNNVEWEEIELFKVKHNITCQVFNKLTAQFPVKIKQHKRVYWLCKCSCGNDVVCRLDGLISGHTKSCGCWKHERLQNKRNKTRSNMIGKVFGRLTVIKLDYTVVFPSGAIRDYYKCQCACGNVHEVLGNNLMSGAVVSCGCYGNEIVSKKMQKDITNSRFGKLVALEPTEQRSHSGSVIWKCICDCGETAFVSATDLITGNIISCGCEGSKGEYRIKQILNNLNIIYLHNKGYFKDLVSDKGNVLRYDFILFDDQTPYRIIEFDGPQHDTPYEYFGGENKFITLQQNDALKNQYALSHNIPLVRIPYSKRDTMSIEDLLGDKYLIKGEI